MIQKSLVFRMRTLRLVTNLAQNQRANAANHANTNVSDPNAASIVECRILLKGRCMIRFPILLKRVIYLMMRVKFCHTRLCNDIALSNLLELIYFSNEPIFFCPIYYLFHIYM